MRAPERARPCYAVGASGTVWRMATELPELRFDMDPAFVKTLDRAKELTGIKATAEVVRLAVTTLVRKTEAEGRIGG